MMAAVSTVPTKPKPSGLLYLLPLAIWIGFSIVAVVLGVRGFAGYERTIDDFARIDSGSTATVDLKSSGGYRVWLERPGLDDDSLRPSTTVTVTAAGGAPVTVEAYDSSTTLSYSRDGRDAVAVHTFDVSRPGEHTITAAGEAGDRFAIGQDNPITEGAKGAAYLVGLGTLGFVIAAIIAIVIAVKRGRSKKQIHQATMASAYGSPSGYGGPSYGGPPPPQGYPASGGYQAPPSYQPPSPDVGASPSGSSGGSPPPPPPPPGWPPSS